MRNICFGRPPRRWGQFTAAEIGRIASKYQSSSCGKATSPSSRSSDESAESFTLAGSEHLGIPDDDWLQISKRQQASEQTQHRLVFSATQAYGKTLPKVTSSAPVVNEGTDKRSVDLGVAMNHVNDHENLKQLNLTPVQVNEVEEMDTQEGRWRRFFSPRRC